MVKIVLKTYHYAHNHQHQLQSQYDIFKIIEMYCRSRQHLYLVSATKHTIYTTTSLLPWPLTLHDIEHIMPIIANVCSKCVNNPSSVFGIIAFTAFVPKAIQMETRIESPKFQIFEFGQKRMCAKRPTRNTSKPNFVDLIIKVCAGLTMLYWPHHRFFWWRDLVFKVIVLTKLIRCVVSTCRSNRDTRSLGYGDIKMVNEYE